MGSCLGHCCVLRRDFRCRGIFSGLRAKHKRDTSLHIELLDDAWSLDDAAYGCGTSNEAMLNITPYAKNSGEIQQCKTPSMDLEWEHLPEMEPSTYMNSTEEKESHITTTSISTCSHATSHDSLEWDPVIGGMSDMVDMETEQLLHEIELLNSRVLEETQIWSS